MLKKKKKDADMLKRQEQLGGAPTGQILDNLNIEINNTSNRLKYIE